MIRRQVEIILALPRLLLTGRTNSGYCHVCRRKTLFLKTGDWLRDQYLCLFCHSIPRQRQLFSVLEKEYPRWSDLRIHESSPCGPASEMIRKRCKGYLGSQYFPDVASGSCRRGVRCENLEKMSFVDREFDLVITQDVFEHVLRPDRAFSEICRTLKPGGAHLFTVPLYQGRKTVTRAVAATEGVKFLQEPVYHSNPVDDAGSLVVTDWGADIIDLIASVSGMESTVFSGRDSRFGIEGEFLEVIVSRKATTPPEGSL
jgi:SAM-dependent methyltransferase